MNRGDREGLSRADTEALSDDVKTSWYAFLDLFEAVRPELYRYCRHLARTPWDAEDLTQDAMAKAFVTLGTVFNPVKSPRAWLFRIASNPWIDRVRRARHELITEAPEESGATAAEDPRTSREAAGTLLVKLACPIA